MTALRLTPLFGFGSRRALRIIERNLLVYKHGWLVLLSGFFEPLFYLLSIGFGLGVLVGDVAGPGRPDDPVRDVRGAGAAGGLGDERRDHREHVQLLLQAELRQDVRVDPDDADVARRTCRSASSPGR